MGCAEYTFYEFIKAILSLNLIVFYHLPIIDLKLP